MKGLDRGGAKGAANFAYGDILCNLENADEGFGGLMGPDREAIE